MEKFDIKYNNATGIILFNSKINYYNDYQISIIDINTNLCVFLVSIYLPAHSTAEFKIPNWYLNAKYNSGFEINNIKNNNIIETDSIILKEINNKFSFYTNKKEPAFEEWKSFMYEDFFENFSITESDVVYDLGSNWGTYTMYANIFNPEQIYAFEPTPENYKYLCKTFNNNKNIRIYNKAISDKNKIETFCLYPNSTSNTLVPVNDDYRLDVKSKIDVECINLLDFIIEYNLLHPTVIKCDIEGSEYMFINSVSDSFFNTVRAIILEFHRNDNKQVYSLIEKLLNLKYTIKILNDVDDISTNTHGTILAIK